MELHRPPLGAGVFDRHHHVRTLRRTKGGGHAEPAADLSGPRVQAVIPARGELGGQPGQQGASGHLDQPRLAVRGFGQQRQLSSGVLHHGLQAQADAEDRQPPRVHLVEQP